MDDYSKALEEFKVFQAIISNHDGMFNTIRGWCITLVTAVSVAFLSKEITIAKYAYLAFACFAVFVFAWSEAVHRVAQTRAMKRSGEIERFFRNEIPYDGPRIRDTLKQGNSISNQIEAIKKPRFFVLYVSLICLILAVGLSA